MSTNDAATGRRLLPSFWRTAPLEPPLLPLSESPSIASTTPLQPSEPPAVRPVGGRSRSERVVHLAPPIAGTTVPHSAQTGTLSAPLTTPVSPTRRRAHTVSVSLASARRPDELSPRVSEDLESGLSAPRTKNRILPRRGSLALGKSDSRLAGAGSPVAFELPQEDHDLSDDIVGMLDVIDMQVSTGMS